jgi:hypothetical protein
LRFLLSGTVSLTYGQRTVLPRIAGDRVSLAIFTANDSVQAPASGAINIQQVQTAVSARVGEWTEILGIDEQGAL